MFCRRRQPGAAALPLFVAMSLALGAAACNDAVRERPDIILISLDSVRADVLNFRDTAATPTLTDLAKDGSVFRNAASGTSWTLPAHVQMLSGSPPSAHGVISDDLTIDPNTALLADELRKSGYFTAGVFTGEYLWGDYGFDRGFDVYQSAMTEFDLNVHDSTKRPRGAGLHVRRVGASANQDITTPLAIRAVDRVLGDLASQPEDKPAFLFLHLFDPHYDYIPQPPFDTLFDPDYTGDLDGRGFWTNTRIWDEDKTPKRRIGDRDLEHLIALYRGEVAWTDSQLGLLFEKLRAAGRLDNALIIITADHGEEFFDHGARGHRHTLFDELTRVPLLIVPPRGTHAPSEINAQVSLSDVMPTALDYAGVPLPPSATGRSLRPAVEGEAFESRPALSSLYFPSLSSRGRQRHRFIHTLRTPDEKLARSVLVGGGGNPRLQDVVWYDLKNDPGEQQPIQDHSDPRLRAAWGRLESEFASLRERHEALPHADDASRSTDMRDALFDQLAALGYVDDESEPAGPSATALKLPWGLAPFPAVELESARKKNSSD